DAQPPDRVHDRWRELDGKTVAALENQAFTFTTEASRLTNHVGSGYQKRSGRRDLELHGDFLFWPLLDGFFGGQDLLFDLGVLRGGLLGRLSVRLPLLFFELVSRTASIIEVWLSLRLPLLFFELLQDAAQGFDLFIEAHRRLLCRLNLGRDDI